MEEGKLCEQIACEIKNNWIFKQRGKRRDRESVYVHKQMDKQIKRERLTDRDRERKRKE